MLARRRPLVLLAAAAAAAGCGASGPSHHPGSPLEVAAAESFWGSIASQLGGSRVHVTSIVANPAADPHDYEPTAADARTLASSSLAIVNGVGYDAWAGKLLAAGPSRQRVVLTVGKLVGVADGGNPHRWYSPADVDRVIAAITAGYTRLDPAGAAAYARNRQRFVRVGLAAYRRQIGAIRHRFDGVRVGASESILAPLASALGLDLVTPASFLNAVSEGSDPTAGDRATIDRQMATHSIAVWVLNVQNETPDVQRLTDEARRMGIPVVAITETMSPASATFQSWQTRQLHQLASALARATGR